MTNIIILLLALLLGGITLYLSVDKPPVAYEPLKERVEIASQQDTIKKKEDLQIEYKIDKKSIDEELASLPEDIANQNKKVRVFIDTNGMFPAYNENFDEARFGDKNGTYEAKIVVKNPNVSTSQTKRPIFANISTPDGSVINAKIDPELIDKNEKVYLYITNTQTKKEQLLDITSQLSSEIKKGSSNTLSIGYIENDSGITTPSTSETKSFEIKQPPSIPDDILKKLGIQ